jgi:hypothetical protein
VPRGSGVDRQMQLRCCRLYESNGELEEWELQDQYISVRRLADVTGLSKSTVHRYVNQDALNSDRRRSRRRRLRIKAGLKK